MIKEPIFFERNRVGRVYIGGKLFNGFFGDEPVDNFEPEEWIASAVKAINKVEKSPKEGISKMLGEDKYFDELIKEYPEEILGKGKTLRILVKALDSAIRLPAQAHPDKAFSRKYFNSNYGKTECWTILDTRPGAKIFFGFKDGVTKEEFIKAIDDSLTDKDAMERLMVEITPKKGDVYFVPAKTVHAIGYGCLILEVQEPTDFTIQPEYWCGDYKLSESEMYIGLSKETAVECFDFVKAPDAKIIPRVLSEDGRVKSEALVGPENTDCFVINRYTLTGGEFVPHIEDNYGLYVVTEGEGNISCEGFSKAIGKGSYFLIPACLMGKCSIEGNLEIVECY